MVSFALPQQTERKTLITFDANDFAARLQTLRKAQGMTQEELAEALNISLEHLSKMERGKRKPFIRFYDPLSALGASHCVGIYRQRTVENVLKAQLVNFHRLTKS